MLAMTTVEPTNVGGFCEGWDDGYKDGWCYNEPPNMCLDPIVPLCPLRTLNDADTYKRGYQRGFIQGKHDRSHN